MRDDDLVVEDFAVAVRAANARAVASGRRQRVRRTREGAWLVGRREWTLEDSARGAVRAILDAYGTAHPERRGYVLGGRASGRTDFALMA